MQYLHVIEHERAKREKFGWSWGSGSHGESAAPGARQKGDILEGEVGQAGTASNIREDGCASSGVKVCVLSADPMQASPSHACVPIGDVPALSQPPYAPGRPPLWKILVQQAYFFIQGLSEPRTLEDDGPVRPREDGGH